MYETFLGGVDKNISRKDNIIVKSPGSLKV